MKIVTFCNVDNSLIDSKHTVEHFQSGETSGADVAIWILTQYLILKKISMMLVLKNLQQLLIIEDDSDYDAFKNFGIDAWIKSADLADINELLNLIEKGFIIIIDTHCHLDNEQYYDDIDNVIKHALENKVKGFLIPGADFKDLPQAIKLAEKYDEIFFAVGIHPYDIEKYDEKVMQEYINHPKCIAVGECGLDYFRLPEDKEEKEAVSKKTKRGF